jgi:hypothetical protein
MRKGALGDILNLTSKHGMGEAAFEGIVFHEMLAAHYQNKSEEDISEILQSAYIPKRKAAEYEEEMLYLTKREQYLWDLYKAYKLHYDHEDFVVVDTETEFITALGDKCFSCGHAYPDEWIKGTEVGQRCNHCKAHVDYVCGRGDLIVLNRGTLQLWDHKTRASSTKEGSSYMLGFGESSQFTQYLYGLSRTLGRKISCGVVNVIVKLKRIAALGNPFHRNDDIVKTEEDFEAFVLERKNLLDRIRTERAKFDGGSREDKIASFPRSTNQCRQYGRCFFLDFCHPTRLDWWKLTPDLADDFVQRDPDYVNNYRNLIEEDVR